MGRLWADLGLTFRPTRTSFDSNLDGSWDNIFPTLGPLWADHGKTLNQLWDIFIA